MTAMIDALDEASDPAGLASQLLRPLMDRSGGLVRLLLGTRRHVCEHLGRGWEDRCRLVDLDSRPYADRPALAAVVRRILTGPPPSLFASCPPAVVDEVTHVIADTAARSFFVARILGETQAAQPSIPDPADPVFHASLPAGRPRHAPRPRASTG